MIDPTQNDDLTPSAGEVIPYSGQIDSAREELLDKLGGNKKSKYGRFIASAALGSIPWIGGVLAAAVALQGEGGQEKLNDIQKLWLHEHEEKIVKLGTTIAQILARLDALGDDIEERIRSEEYLALIRKGFQVWDQADSQEKRDLIRKLLSNAGGTRLCSDDVVRMFIEWIDRYHELHFKVIREVYRHPGITRAEIWANIYGEQPRDDSAEADLFKFLMHELTTGYVVRQERETNADGQFLAQRRTSRRSARSAVMKSPFDDEKQIVLTELGKQFVHYTMDEIVPRIG